MAANSSSWYVHAMVSVFVGVIATLAACFLLFSTSFAASDHDGTNSISGSNIDCDKSRESLSTCIQYLIGKAITPPHMCCTGIEELYKSAKTTEDRMAACECLRHVAGRTPAFRPDRVFGVNSLCDTKLPSDVFINSGCSNVK